MEVNILDSILIEGQHVRDQRKVKALMLSPRAAVPAIAAPIIMIGAQGCPIPRMLVQMLQARHPQSIRCTVSERERTATTVVEEAKEAMVEVTVARTALIPAQFRDNGTYHRNLSDSSNTSSSSGIVRTSYGTGNTQTPTTYSTAGSGTNTILSDFSPPTFSDKDVLPGKTEWSEMNFV
ncbi:hypothetical protein MPER_00577 [Moniliophthora perniciosa FA553]|nr:hypothetical protein MPER_00577 [Moniliophthora perniciosa FA553]